MRLVYVTSSVFPSRAAHTIQQMNMCRAFAANGHDVTMLAPRRAEEQVPIEDLFRFYDVPPVFSVRRLPWPRVKGRQYVYSTLAALSAWRMRPDLIVGRCPHTCLFCALAGLPVAYESHEFPEHVSRSTGFVIHALLRSPRLVRLVTTTKATKRAFTQRLDVAAEKITVASNGADDVPVDGDRADLARSEARLQVGYVGHLYPGKGMEIIEPLAEACPWADFHVVGGTDEDIRRWKDRLRDAANVRFHGFVPQERTAAFRRAFDVLLAPYQRSVSTSGSDDPAPWMSPLKVFEYLSAGKPMLCSDLPVLREVLTHDENAWLCPPDRPEAWARALARLRDEPDTRERLGRRARRDFEQHYTWRARARKVLGAAGQAHPPSHASKRVSSSRASR